MEATITYSLNQQIQGWDSFHSWIPDYCLGMNNQFYSWKSANLYLHNSNSLRNNFYGEQYTSRIQTVLNEDVLTNKLFKTLAIQGDSGWSAEIETDIQTGATIDESWFEKKEQVWFAYIRNANDVPATPEEFALRTVNGIGRSTSFSGAPTAIQVNFAITPKLIAIGSGISIGDYLYYAVPPYDTPVLCGAITNIVQNYRNGQNYLIVNTTIGSVPINQTDFYMVVKNGIAESVGMLGHFAIVTLENSSTEKIELFALTSEVSKSFP